MTESRGNSFRERLLNHDLLIGTRIKTPSPIVCEVLGKTDLDTLCLHAEHAPFGRGFAGSSRAAEFTGKAIADQLRESAEQTTIIAQIEDVDALNVIDEIAAIERLDCLLIGRIDLTVALGRTDPNDSVVVDAVASIRAAGKKAGTAVGMFVSDLAEAKQWQDHGASLFLLQSDQAFLLVGAANLTAALR